jgi:hypothetical protein
MSPALSRFLADWHTWATTGAPEGDTHEGGFSRRFGLCFHARKRSEDIADELEDILVAEFPDNADMPFNHNLDYWEEGDRGMMHRNPMRLAWVRQKLASEL